MVAANVGGVDALLAGRDGSWEADLVRQAVEGTAGTDDRNLLAPRTEPVRLTLDVEGVFEDCGLYRLYEDAVDELGQRVDEAAAGLWEAVATAEERGQLAVVQAALPQLGGPEWDSGPDGSAARFEEAGAIIRAVEARAAESGHPLACLLLGVRQAAPGAQHEAHDAECCDT